MVQIQQILFDIPRRGTQGKGVNVQFDIVELKNKRLLLNRISNFIGYLGVWFQHLVLEARRNMLGNFGI